MDLYVLVSEARCVTRWLLCAFSEAGAAAAAAAAAEGGEYRIYTSSREIAYCKIIMAPFS